jgi:hypothetical protein
MSLTDATLQTNASFLISDLSSNGCQSVAATSVSDFQSSYNAAGGSPALTVDGLYGANTSSALQQVINANAGSNAAFAGETAPAGCVAQGGGGGGGGNVPVVVSTGSSGSGALPYIIGAIVVAGALAAYTYSHKKGHKRH